MRRFHVSRPDAGFALLEVLVAMVVVGLVLSAVGAVVAVTFVGIRSAADRLALSAAGQSLLDSLPEGDALIAGTTTGAMGGILWSVDVVPLKRAAAETEIPSDPQAVSAWRPASVDISARTKSGRRLHFNTTRLIRRSAA